MGKTIRSLVTMMAFGAAVLAARLPAQVLEAEQTLSVQQYRLKNGLRVVLSVDDSLPLVCVVVAYGAGSGREKQGQVGLAYLNENLMFQGSENVSPLQHINFIQKAGGEWNALTTFDKSLFYQTLPSNHLALALWLESDRMKSLAINSASIEGTRDKLLEENRRRLATAPYLESFATFDMLLYPDFTYGHPLISRAEDIRNLSADDVKAFHNAYYLPNNAVLCIVGDIHPAKTKELVAHYFEAVPPGPDVPPLPLPQFDQKDEVVQTIKETLLPSPGFHIGYRFFPLHSSDLYTLKVVEYLLLQGKASRLYSRIVKKDRTAFFLEGGLEEKAGVLAFKVFATNNNELMTERCEKAITSEIDKLKSNLLSTEELERAKNLFKMDYLRRLSSVLDRALLLTDAVFSNVPPESLLSELDHYMRVTPFDVIAMVNRQFMARNKVILNLGTR